MRAGYRGSSLAVTLGGTCLLTATSALAHPLGSPAGGLTAGLLHPLGGLDHLLAMLAVGLWAAQRGGRERWLLPVAFVGAMALGGAAALAGLALPSLDAGIALSVLLLGAAVLAAPRLPMGAAVSLVAAVALLHGQAHGSELAPGLSPLLYAGGFLAATAALHAAGVLAGGGLLRLRAAAATAVLRGTGAGIALAGGALLLAAL